MLRRCGCGVGSGVRRVEVEGEAGRCLAAVGASPSWVWATLESPYVMRAACALVWGGVPGEHRIVSSVSGVPVGAWYEGVV